MSALYMEVLWMSPKQRVASRYVSMVDRVPTITETVVPAFTGITNVTTGETVAFTRVKDRPAGAFWAVWNDLTLASLVGLDAKGDCE